MFPDPPNSFKNLIPSAGGQLCDKFVKLFQLPLLFYRYMSYMINADGTDFTPAYKGLICQIDCTGIDDGGENPPNENMPAPTLSASDGQYADKVALSWNTVTPPDGIDAVTQYKIYRSLSTNTDPNNAVLLTTINAPTTVYDDTTAVEGTTYHYWATATNGTQTSAYSDYNSGHRGEVSNDLDPVSDLQATQGFYGTDDGLISLVFTPPTGATKFDLYRNTSDDFATATLIVEDAEPLDTEDPPAFAVTNGDLWDNIDEYVFFDLPPLPTVVYYYWVKAKKDAPPAVSDESNSAAGWVKIGSDDPDGIVARENFSSPYTVPAGVVRLRMTVLGAGGGGAGGGQIYGGGGGGAGPVALLDMEVAEGDVIEWLNSDGATGNAAAMTNGTAGGTITIEKNDVVVATLTGGGGGVYNSSGNGAGGAGGAASGTAVVAGFDGADGEAASGVKGGRSGHRFGAIRRAAAHYNGFSLVGSWEGDGSGGTGGGGSRAQTGVSGAPDATGGQATTNTAVYCAYNI